MKAILIEKPGGPEVMQIGDLQTPEADSHQILVKVAATALNRADLLQRQGLYPPPPGESPIMGLEMSGIVHAVGSEVRRWRIGDRVCGLLAGGGYAEFALIHEDMAMPVPEGLDLEQAAGLPEVFLTAFQALRLLARLQPAERVLIHAGGSGVGTAAIQLAREMGAEVLVTASAGKHAICRELGAAKAIDYHTEDFQEVIKEYTDGKGVNVILDFIAAPYFHSNLKSLSVDGRLVLLALLGGTKVDSVDLRSILVKRIHLMGTTLRARSLDYKKTLTREFWEFAKTRLEDGRLRPVIDSSYSWKQVAEAHSYMATNKNIGKIILTIS